MKKICLVIFLLFIFSLPVNAADINGDYNEKIDNILKEYNLDLAEIIESPFETIWQETKQTITNYADNPIKNFKRIAAVLIFSSIINFFISQHTVNVVKLVNTVSVLMIFGNIFQDFFALIDRVSIAFFDVKNFMISFLPVFAGISFASGEMITSTVYTGFFLICVVTVANLCVNYIIPSINIFMAVGVTNAVSDIINLKPVCEFYSKAVKVTMTAAVSVLCFILSLQTTIAQGQDTLAVKTGKMLVTSAVPIIGSTLQGAVGSVYASMGVLKGFCGLAGVAVIISIFFPHIVRLVISWAGYFILILLSNVLENETAAELLSVFRQVVEIMLSISVLFMVLLLFSISIMIKMFQGV